MMQLHTVVSWQPYCEQTPSRFALIQRASQTSRDDVALSLKTGFHALPRDAATSKENLYLPRDFCVSTILVREGAARGLGLSFERRKSFQFGIIRPRELLGRDSEKLGEKCPDIRGSRHGAGWTRLHVAKRCCGCLARYHRSSGIGVEPSSA